MPYAWLAAAAYGKTHAGKQRRKGANDDLPTSADLTEKLKALGWTQWEDFPQEDLTKLVNDAHLRVEVWQHQALKSVVVAFGGTIFRNGKDWHANLRWFLPKQKDEYTCVVESLAPAFLEAFKKKHRADANVRLFSAGHSLGGGLAQQFAYCLPEDAAVPRVSKVYAFDPSPVTGFFSVNPTLRKENRKSLEIDRIYERLEILALIRSITSTFVRPSARDPAIRELRYNLFRSWNAIASHSIVRMAQKLDATVSEEERVNTPLTSREDTFHLEEYKQLRTEILSLLSRLDTLLQYAAIIAASVYAWIAAQSFGVLDHPTRPCISVPPEFLHVALFIPPVLVLVLSLMAWATSRRIHHMGTYLRKLESRLSQQKGLGWERFRDGRKTFTTVLTFTVWIISFGAAVYATWDGCSLLQRARLNPSCKSDATHVTATPLSSSDPLLKQYKL